MICCQIFVNLKIRRERMFRRKLESDTKSMIFEIILKFILPGRENGYCPKRDFVLQWIINFPRGRFFKERV